MNQFLFFTFLLISLSGKAQSLFYDQLNGSVWTSSTGIIKNQSVGLQKTAPENAEHIWTFKDGQPTIESFNDATGTWHVTGSYSYTIDETYGILQITTESQVIRFQVGIISTGTAAYLTPEKERKRR